MKTLFCSAVFLVSSVSFAQSAVTVDGHVLHFHRGLANQVIMRDITAGYDQDLGGTIIEEPRVVVVDGTVHLYAVTPGKNKMNYLVSRTLTTPWYAGNVHQLVDHLDSVQIVNGQILFRGRFDKGDHIKWTAQDNWKMTDAQDDFEVKSVQLGEKTIRLQRGAMDQLLLINKTDQADDADTVTDLGGDISHIVSATVVSSALQDEVLIKATRWNNEVWARTLTQPWTKMTEEKESSPTSPAVVTISSGDQTYQVQLGALQQVVVKDLCTDQVIELTGPVTGPLFSVMVGQELAVFGIGPKGDVIYRTVSSLVDSSHDWISLGGNSFKLQSVYTENGEVVVKVLASHDRVLERNLESASKWTISK